MANASSANNSSLPFPFPFPPPNHLSTTQVDRLLETAFSAPKLTGRQVLVPLSKYAFVPGTLQPTLDESTGEEQVNLSVPTTAGTNGTPRTEISCSTATARVWLQERSSQPSGPDQRTTKASTGRKGPAPSILKQSKPITASSSSALPQSSSSSSSSPSSSSYRMDTPFVEIQEEYNAEGTQTSGGIVDVSKRLEALWKMNDVDPGGSVAAVAAAATSIVSNVAPPSSSSSSSSSFEESAHPVLEEPPLKPLSDKEYQNLSSRLEELAKLEEEAKHPRHKSKVKKSLAGGGGGGGGGWAKGFLNNSSGGGTKKQKKTAPATKSSTTASTSSTAAATSSKSSSSVAFDTDRNQVLEIPRIGTQKVPPKPGSATATAASAASSMSTQSRPLETSIFNGVIQERPVVTPSPGGIQERKAVVLPKKKKKPLQSQEQSSNVPKRLSRFAQERQGQGHGQ